MTSPATAPDRHPRGATIRTADIPAQLGRETADLASLGAPPPPGSCMFHGLVELDQEAADG